jgi:YidC/Oxa1 family membrane protein insertase
MSYLYQLIFFQPLLNALIFLYETIAFKDLGLAIILLTLLIRILLFPVFQKSAEHQAAIQQLQPKIKKIQEEHKSNKEAQSQAMVSLFKEHKVNPFSGFFFLLIQLPIIIALYHIFTQIIQPDVLNNLYAITPRPDRIIPDFLGLLNLGESNIVMVSLAAITQFFQAKQTLPPVTVDQKLSPAEQMTRRMIYLGPLLTLFIFSSLPAAVSLYWTASSVFSILQQLIINRRIQHAKLGNIS